MNTVTAPQNPATGFTVAPPRIPFPGERTRRPVLPALGKIWRDYTAPGVYEAVQAVTADGQWLFQRQDGGTWATGHLPTKTEVKTGLRTLRACRAYAGSGKAAEDLRQAQSGEARS